MRFLGIDPGSRRAGYGLIEIQGRKLKYIDSGVLRYDKVGNFMERLGVIYESCRDLSQKYAPSEVAFESLIYVKSVPALSKLAQARGAMIAAFAETHRGKIFEYSPNLVKSSVAGHGHMEKEGVAKSLRMIFPEVSSFKYHDESDGLAIAVCHSLLRGNPLTEKGHPGRKRGSSLKQAFKYLEKR